MKNRRTYRCLTFFATVQSITSTVQMSSQVGNQIEGDMRTVRRVPGNWPMT
jgi:hypothetical protein